MLDRPGGQVALRPAAAWPAILACSALRPERLPSSCWRSARTRAERARLVGARAVEPDPGVDEALLGARDLVAALLDDRGDALLADLELVQARRGGRRVGLGVVHELDDLLVLLGDALHELAALEQLGEALGGHDHGDDVGLVGLVELDEPLRRAPRGPGPGGRAGAPAGGARRAGRAGCRTARRAWRRGRPARWLLALEGADAALQAPDALRVGADLRGQHALGALAPADLALRGLDLALQVVQAAARRRRALGEHRQRRPERERQYRTREQEAKTHAAAHVTRAIEQGST